jgi:hypothetical protein
MKTRKKNRMGGEPTAVNHEKWFFDNVRDNDEKTWFQDYRRKTRTIEVTV